MLHGYAIHPGGASNLQGSGEQLANRKMMSWLRAICDFFYEMFFGCSHGHLTRPFTLQASTYKVCLDCGRHFPYSLDKMRPLHPWEIAKQLLVEPVSISVETGLSERTDYNRTKAVA
jgi:hypothetical protein